MSENILVKKKVLVFPCGSEIGLEIHRSLAFSTHFTLIGGSSIDDHGKFVYQNYVGNLPFVHDEQFTDKLNRIIEEHDIDFIVPAHDSVVLKLAQDGAAGRLRCEVITSGLETCEVARSKRRTYEFFQDKLPTPKVYSPAQLEKSDGSIWPIFLKPDVGQGGKGTFLAQSLRDIHFYLAKDQTLLCLEYLPGKEYTIDCFTDKDGSLRFVEGRERARIANGISVSAKLSNHHRFREFAEIINDALSFKGAWFFQLKERKDGELVLLEFAPRIAGTMGFARLRGVNLALLSLFNAMGYEVGVLENDYEIVMDRALENRYQHNLTYEHVYLDFDDLVLFDNKVNPYVMAFIYQCHNKGVAIHLITKHKLDLKTTLNTYHLSNVFDEVIWIQDGTPKSQYITEKNAIFIDDSFAERKEVYDMHRLAVFDSHMIEGLLEKF